ncbi:DUF3576 domain-containing protein [Salipiger bermudensis]|uniref:DUF3576 domain-containing protein n=1 Tax=Salipiger bermudensis TaxID=344736 RepID=UPI0035148976
MTRATARIVLLSLAMATGLTGCGKFASEKSAQQAREDFFEEQEVETDHTKIFSMFIKPDREEVGEVNRYLWNASLEVLNFLPVETIDPFSGVVSTGYGTPPGGGRAYRATVYVTDSALDARSLNVALQSRGGPVSIDTQRAVEDAILTRARQLRVADLGR